MWEKIKEFFGIVSTKNFTTPRACLSGFLRSLDKCDVNADGQINSKELLKLYKDTTIKAVVSYEMTNSEIDAYIESFEKRM